MSTRQKIKYGENPRKLGHNDTVYVEEIFTKEQMQRDDITYGVCWAILNPGMTLEAHKHPIMELYVFLKGNGQMTINEDTFDVEGGDAVLIPYNEIHTVTNPKEAKEELCWFSLGYTRRTKPEKA